MPRGGLQSGVRGLSGLMIDFGIPLPMEGTVTPVTLLGGFLGAGKTTLLKQLLENREGLRVGVVVNDVAAVNVDSQLVRSHLAGEDGIEIAQLQNGCVCCSLADDLFTAVGKIMLCAPAGGSFDHIVVELSGVSEPEMIRKNWRIAKEIGHPVAHRSGISRVVTVVDASCFGADWFDGRNAAARNEAGLGSASRRSIIDLLAEQVETADMVLLNKSDLTTDAELSAVGAVVSGVNPSAEVLPTQFGAVSPAQLLPPAGSAAPDPARAGDHGHAGAEIDGVSPRKRFYSMSPRKRYGIYSFVYSARRPFSAARLGEFTAALCEDQQSAGARQDGRLGLPGAVLSGLLRAKGVCWVDGAPLHEHAWSFAGRRSTLTKGEPWWGACTDQHLEWRCAYPGMQTIYDSVRRECWDEAGEWGDRRQELVFIGGPEMDEAALRTQLDACTLDDEEMEAFAKSSDDKVEFDMMFGLRNS